MQLTDIKKIRKRLNLTQSSLASASGVSQSLIAKIESGRVDPTYTNAQRIFDTLDRLLHKTSKKASEIMCPKVISCGPQDSVHVVAKSMRTNSISQMPVVADGRVIGLVTETGLLDAAFDADGKVASQIMEDAPPIISTLTGQEVIFTLLKYYPLLVVQDHDDLVGVITKADLLRSVK